jgi:Carboxypeptidase regulatory-like domain/TonB dependent receptor
MRRYFHLVWIAFFVVVGSGNLFAQATASGTVLGTVSDQSQAVIAGTSVTITNEATGEVRSMKTGDNGSYRFDLLSAGKYTVKVSKDGFSSAVVSVELLVGATAAANVSLTPGTVAQSVEVAATNPLVDLTKTGVSQQITPKEVEELPMVGRDVANLAYLAPGVKAADSYDPTKNRYAILSVNGGDGRNVNVTVNGVDNKDNTVGGPVMQLPLEAVEEFAISTQRFSAENGRSQGAAINMITKRGTNKYHGSLFGYFRDAALDLDEQDPNGDGTSSPAHPDYSRQQFGGSIGGPIKRDRLFSFFALERERESQGLVEGGKAYTELVLAKNAGLAAEPAATIPRPFFETRYNGRMDWTINNSNSAYLSYSSQANNSLNDQSDGTGDLTNGNSTTNHLQLVGLTLNSIITPTIVNQLTTGFQYWNNLIASDISVPNIIFPDAQFGTNTNVPQQSYQRKWQFKDDVSISRGKHTLKAGVDYIWTPVQGGFFESNSTLSITFAADPSVILGDAVTYPQQFHTAGAVTAMSYSNGDAYFNVATKQLGLYAEDDWKLTPRLTLNLGLRWDRDFNMFGQSDIKKNRTWQELVAINNSFSNPYTAMPHDDNLDFSPRVGFAYDLTGKGNHVLRGGFGLYFGNTFQNIPLFMEQQANATVYQTVFNPTSPTDTVPGTGLTLGEWQYGISPLPTLPPPATQLASGSSIGRIIDSHYRNPVAEEFNVGYSWALTTNTVFEAEYTHVLGLHENKTINIDQRIPVNGVCCTAPLDSAFIAAGQPKLGSVRNEEAINRSRYDGMNLSLRQRMSHHFQVEGNYTLSRAYSYDGGGGIGASSFRNYPRLATAPLASYEWGPSSDDERSHVTISGIVELPWKFQLAPILQFGSARPYNANNTVNALNTGGGTTLAVVVPKTDPKNYFAYAGNSSGAQNCFYFTQQCTIAQFDSLRGDPFFQFDMRLAKNITLGEGRNLQLVGQAFNLTNRANYGNNFGNDIASASSWGHPVGFINPSSTTVPRSLWGEFGARFSF